MFSVAGGWWMVDGLFRIVHEVDVVGLKDRCEDLLNSACMINVLIYVLILCLVYKACLLLTHTFIMFRAYTIYNQETLILCH